MLRNFRSVRDSRINENPVHFNMKHLSRSELTIIFANGNNNFSSLLFEMMKFHFDHFVRN